MTERVRDQRGLYLRPGQGADSVVAEQSYQARTIIGTNGAFNIDGGSADFGGVLISARGGAGVTVDVYDGTQASDEIEQHHKAGAETSTFDGFINFPINIQRGIRVVIANAAAATRVTIYWRK